MYIYIYMHNTFVYITNIMLYVYNQFMIINIIFIIYIFSPVNNMIVKCVRSLSKLPYIISGESYGLTENNISICLLF